MNELDMRMPYVPPVAELICFRPLERLTVDDEFQSTMDLFQTDVETYDIKSDEVEWNPWG